MKSTIGLLFCLLCLTQNFVYGAEPVTFRIEIADARNIGDIGADVLAHLRGVYRANVYMIETDAFDQQLNIPDFQIQSTEPGALLDVRGIVEHVRTTSIGGRLSYEPSPSYGPANPVTIRTISGIIHPGYRLRLLFGVKHDDESYNDSKVDFLKTITLVRLR